MERSLLFKAIFLGNNRKFRKNRGLLQKNLRKIGQVPDTYRTMWDAEKLDISSQSELLKLDEHRNCLFGWKIRKNQGLL